MEFVTVFCGGLEIEAGEHTFQIQTGESLRFKADSVHAYRNIGAEVLMFHNILYNP